MGLSRDDWVTTKFGTGLLGYAIGILTPMDFQVIVDGEKDYKQNMILNLASLNVRGPRDSNECVRLLCEILNLSVDITVVQLTHFICAKQFQVLENDFVVHSAFRPAGCD